MTREYSLIKAVVRSSPDHIANYPFPYFDPIRLVRNSFSVEHKVREPRSTGCHTFWFSKSFWSSQIETSLARQCSHRHLHNKDITTFVSHLLGKEILVEKLCALSRSSVITWCSIIYKLVRCVIIVRDPPRVQVSDGWDPNLETIYLIGSIIPEKEKYKKKNN